MDYKKIRFSLNFMSSGFLFSIISLFSSFSSFKGKSYMVYFAIAMIPGILLFTIGAFLIRKEKVYFKASYILYLCLDIIFVFYIVFSVISKTYIKDEEKLKYIDLICRILGILISVLLAVGNSLYANGLKEAFIKRGNVLMSRYSWVMKFAATKLVLLSVAIPTIKTSFISQTTIASISLSVNFLIQLSFQIFMVVAYYQLKDNNTIKEVVK